MRTIEKELGRCPLFEGVGETRLRELARAGHLATHPAGSVILRAGEPAAELYVILIGEASVLGKPHARTLGSGDYFGEMALLDRGLRSATIAAVGELRTLVLPSRAVLKLGEQEPRLGHVMAAELSRRVRRLEGAAAPASLPFDTATGWPRSDADPHRKGAATMPSHSMPDGQASASVTRRREVKTRANSLEAVGDQLGRAIADEFDRPIIGGWLFRP